MKKKLLSVFVMLLMTVVSAMAQVVEKGIIDEYVQTVTFNTVTTGSGESYSAANDDVTVYGSYGYYDGMIINGNSHIKITAHDRVKIVKVDLHYKGGGTYSKTQTTAGEVKNGSIVNAYADEMTINNSTPTTGSTIVQIDQVKVYYVKVAHSDTETQSPTRQEDYFTVDGVVYTSGDNGNKSWNIGGQNGNLLSIDANGNWRISKVEFTYSSETVAKDETIADNTICSSGTVNFDATNHHIIVTDIPNVSNLTITCPNNTGKVLITNLTIYYDELEAPSVIKVAANKVDDAYWATFYSGASNYRLPEGTEAFKVKLVGTKLTMIKLNDVLVEKENGVVLRSNTDNIVMEKTDAVRVDSYSDNSLVGTMARITNPGNAYVLNYKESGGLGFYKLSSTGTIGMNRAYLVYEEEVASEAREFFGFAETTGIELNKVEANEDKMYDLQGRLVTNPVKGVYVVNGKKVIKK